MKFCLGREDKGFLVKGNCQKWDGPKEKPKMVWNLNREFILDFSGSNLQKGKRLKFPFHCRIVRARKCPLNNGDILRQNLNETFDEWMELK